MKLSEFENFTTLLYLACPAWYGIMPEIGYEGFKTANGSRVWIYPAELSNQGLSTIKITTRDGYQLILRFPGF